MADDVRVIPGPAGTDLPERGLRVSLLGSMRVEFDGKPIHVAGRQRRRLLALLASRPGRVVPVEALVDAMWGDDPPPSAAKTMQSHVVRLRQSLAAAGDPIETTPGGYRLNVEPTSSDVARFERLAADGAAELRLGHFAASTKLLEAAIALWRGPALMEFGEANFAVGDRVRLEERRLIALEDLAEARLGTGAAPAVVPEMERVVADEPGRERAWALLMRALHASGRQHDALDAYQRARAVLGEEFGLEPSQELRDLERRIVEQDPTLLGPGNRAALPAPLRDDTALVGREHELAWLGAAWTRACTGVGQVRAVLGPTGSGRTRLVAELATAVIADGGSVEYVPGAAGLHLIADGTGPGSIIDAVGLRCRAAPLLLVVDDVEWTPPSSVDAIRALASAAERLMLFLVLIGHNADGPGNQLIRELERSSVSTLDLAPMSDREIAAVVSGEGVDAEAIDAAVAMAGGLPGVARREAAAWAERAASDRLHVAASISIGARSAATIAGASVLDEVLRLVEARGRRSALLGAEWMGRQPYRSLASYESADADLFVGRERLVAELTARVLDRRLVAVVGASGSGKSSVVRAGLLPLVRSGRLPGEGPWRADVIVPGSDPLAAIDAVAGLDEPGPQLLVVDQFEEVLASGLIDDVAGRLLDLVLDPALDVRVVLVARADQLGALASSRALAELIEDAQVLVGPPSDDELRRIVIEPARRTGCTVEPALVSMIASDVAGHDAALPLVSAAMAEVWERRDGDALSAQSYVELGGLAAAVERLGERALAAVGPSGHSAMRAAMLRLVDVTDDGVWVRRRVDIADLPPELGPAIDALVDARLVARTGETVDVVHEVVFRAWPQMVIWLEEARADLTLERDLRAAARSWDAQGRSDDDVLRGGRFQAATDWAARRGDAPPQIVDLIVASREWAERDDRAIRAQLAREQRSKRRLRGALVAASLLLVVALAAGVLFLGQRNEAEEATVQADARRVGAQALLVDNIDHSLLLAVEGMRLDDSTDTRANVLAALARSPELIRSTRGDETELTSVASSPDGEVVGVAQASGRASFYDTSTWQIVGSYDELPVGQLEFRPDGRQLAVTARGPGGGTMLPEGSVRLVDPATWEDEPVQLGGIPEGVGVSWPRYSHDGRFLVAWFDEAAVEGDTIVAVWDLASRDLPVLQRTLPGTDYAAALSPDGSRLYIASLDPPTMTVYDVATNRRLQSESAPGTWGLDISPDGSLLAAAGGTDIVILDATTLEERHRLPGHTSDVRVARFSPNGALLASGSDDGTAIVWDVATGERQELLTGHAAAVYGVAFNPDGDTLYTAGLDGALLTWDLVGDRRFIPRRALTEPPLPAEAAIASPSHDAVAYTGGADELQFVDLETGRAGRFIDSRHGTWGSFPWRPDGRRFATTGDDGYVRIWDWQTGQLIAERQVASIHITGLDYTGDGRRLVVGEQTGTTYAIDAETLELDGKAVELDRRLENVIASPDNHTAIVVTTDQHFSVVDLDTGRVDHEGDAPGAGGGTFSPDGRRFALSGRGAVRILDVETGEWVGPPRKALTGTIFGMDYAPDGATFATGAADTAAIVLWDAGTGAPLNKVLVGRPDEGKMAPTFLADGYTVMITTTGGAAIYTLDTRPEHWIQLACAIAGRNLTRDEWSDAFNDRPYRETCPSGSGE